MDPKIAQKGVVHFLLIGLVMLVVLGAGVLLYIMSAKPTVTSKPTPNPTKTIAQNSSFDLKIDSPTKDAVVTNGLLSVSGTTAPQTTVALYTDTDESMVESDTNGKFQATIPLVSGLNTVTVKAFADDGTEKSVSIDVVYNDK